MLQNPEPLENIITAASRLHNDPVAIGLVLKPETSSWQHAFTPKLSSQHKTSLTYVTDSPACEMEHRKVIHNGPPNDSAINRKICAIN